MCAFPRTMDVLVLPPRANEAPVMTPSSLARELESAVVSTLGAFVPQAPIGSADPDQSSSAGINWTTVVTTALPILLTWGLRESRAYMRRRRATKSVREAERLAKEGVERKVAQASAL